MSLRLWDTMTRRVAAFTPSDPTRVTMYVCGPTVYDYAHIGNARPAVVFDVLFRLLRRRFAGVVYARNLTDIDDKINDAAAANGVSIGVWSQRFIDAYHADMHALGVLPPTVEPRVTAHLDPIIDMISRLLSRGHAYVAADHVLFEVSTFGAYGRLSGRDRAGMLAGARVEVAPHKRDPADFVLWKPSLDDQPGWPSPWGRGRPGWHIECSAMIEHNLGRTIDLHGGGQDLIFPHHENEIAQGTTVHDGELYCRHWMHNGFVTVQGRKMSKSLGNVLLVRDLLAEAPGEAVRLGLLSAHYRQPLDWTKAMLAQAKRTLDRLYRKLEELPAKPPPPCPALLAPVEAALDQDLDVPKALAAIFALARDARRMEPGAARRTHLAALRHAGGLLGLLQDEPRRWQEAAPQAAAEPAIRQLVAARAAARQAGDYATADALRTRLSEHGIAVEDDGDTTTWRWLST